jgi:hypothetical protein
LSRWRAAGELLAAAGELLVSCGESCWCDEIVLLVMLLVSCGELQ